uniref:Putative secreted protein n=1 Tax=Psorophora albipes TaxID=869069 RepID=T1E2P0_9DIPT
MHKLIVVLVLLRAVPTCIAVIHFEQELAEQLDAPPTVLEHHRSKKFSVHRIGHKSERANLCVFNSIFFLPFAGNYFFLPLALGIIVKLFVENLFHHDKYNTANHLGYHLK